MEAAEQYALAIDLGTGGPKVGLVSLTGRLAWFEHLRVETRVLPDGGAEQDAGEWWELDHRRCAARRLRAVPSSRPRATLSRSPASGRVGAG